MASYEAEKTTPENKTQPNIQRNTFRAIAAESYAMSPFNLRLTSCLTNILFI